MASMAAFLRDEASPLGGAEAERFLRGGMVLFGAVALVWRAGAARAVMRRKTGELWAMLACRWALLEPSACPSTKALNLPPKNQLVAKRVSRDCPSAHLARVGRFRRGQVVKLPQRRRACSPAIAGEQ